MDELIQLAREVRILQRMRIRSIADDDLLAVKEKELDRMIEISEIEVRAYTDARAHTRTHTRARLH